MKGLEATEIKLSELSNTLRLDAEFFRKKFLRALKEARDANGELLSRATNSIVHPVEVERVYSNSGIQIVLAQNVRNNAFDFSNEAFMPVEMRQILNNNLIERNDVVMTRSGANYGQSACYKFDVPVYACADVLVLKPHEIAGGYLSTFFNTWQGRALLDRGAYGAAQPHIAPPYLKSLPIPRFSHLESKIDEIVEQSIEIASSSAQLYTQAETLLMEALGLNNWQPPEPLTYASTRSAAFSAGRLDAEHFQPKYAALLEHLQNHAPRLRTVRDFALHCDRGEQPKYFEDGTLAVVNSRHILENGLDYDNFERTDSSFWNHPRFHSARIQKHDILTYMTGGYSKKPGRTAVYMEDERALASNEVNVLRLREENSVYVAITLNSMIGRTQAAQTCTGSVQQHLYPNDIASFTVPFVDKATESAIVAAAESSHAARRRAKGLLEAAKRAVEIAIEKDEMAALTYLKTIANAEEV